MIEIQPEASLLTPFWRRLAEAPERRLLVLVAEDGGRHQATASDLHRGASAWAERLRTAGVARGRPVILAHRHSLELAHAFLGALYHGALPAIFAFLSARQDPGLHCRRLRALAGDLGAAAVLASPELLQLLEPRTSDTEPCALLPVEPMPVGSTAPPAAVPALDPEAPALLQLSSGSTGPQKTVTLSHRAILANLRDRSRAFDLRHDDVVVSWLPLYHDMGLVSGLLLPVVAGIQAVLLSPFQWVKNPTLLFELVDEYRGSLCWMPNFAFDHCARNVREERLRGLDLSHWRVLANGSEPVRHESIEAFVARFAPSGFDARSVVAAYGLAENTVGVSATEPGRLPRVDWVDLEALQYRGRAVPAAAGATGSTAVVSCGRPYGGTEVVIVDEESCALPERCVGEILLRGDSLFSGYWRQPALTAQALRDGWLATGDLGYLAAGQLHVCGRRKDLLLVAGRNLHPQDLESIAHAVPGIRPGRVVAFGVPDPRLGSEAVVLVCELRSTVTIRARPAIERELRRRLVRHLDVVPWRVSLVDDGWILKTSSGKLARSANRDKWLAGERG